MKSAYDEMHPHDVRTCGQCQSYAHWLDSMPPDVSARKRERPNPDYPAMPDLRRAPEAWIGQRQ